MALTALLEKLGKLIKEMLYLVRDTEENRKDIKELQEQLTATREVVRELAHRISLTQELMEQEFKRLNEREENGRENMELRMETFMAEVDNRILRARLKDNSSSEDNDE